MANIKVELNHEIIDGQPVTFVAPCDCTAVTGLKVQYPGGSKVFTFKDSHGNALTGLSNLFSKGAYVKAILDVNNSNAYLQNADTNAYLEAGIIKTYTHSSGNLTGDGVNGKFKATTTGTISSIKVNGTACSVKCGEETSIDLIAGNWYTFILDGNTVNFSSGGAGGGLNFKVVCNPQPASPSENTIWIDTDRINNTHFSATQPENMAEYDVWITIGASSPVAFSATKKNPIMVYPIYAKQFIGGTLVDVTAKSWQGGSWVDWTLYILKANNLYDGWSTLGTLGVSKESKGIRITRSSSAFGVCVYDSKVGIANLNTIYARYSAASGAVLQLKVNDTENILDYGKATVNATSGVASGILKLSLDGLQDYKELYVATAIVGGANGTALVEEIWFE